MFYLKILTKKCLLEPYIWLMNTMLSFSVMVHFDFWFHAKAQRREEYHHKFFFGKFP